MTHFRYQAHGLLIYFLSFSAFTQANELNQLSDAELDSRYQFVTSRLNEQHTNGFLWQRGWEGIYGASAIIQVARWSSADTHDDKVQFRVSTIKSLVAFGAVHSNPIPSSRVYNTMPCDMCEKDSRFYKINRLEQAEQALKDRALRAKNIHSFKRHGIAVAFNVLAGLYVAKQGNREDGVASAVSGIISSEINIFTQPSQAKQDWLDYQQLGQSKTADVWNWKVVPIGNGLGLNIQF
jgi:hypothetical protein